MSKILHLDVETTGKKYWKHSIHQIGIIIEIDGKEVNSLEFNCRPHILAEIDPEALKYCGLSSEIIKAYPNGAEVIQDLKLALGEFCNISDPLDRYTISGYNVSYFDYPFFESWFAQCQDTTFNDWFWHASIDVMSLCAFFFQENRSKFNSFSLKSIAKYLGIPLDETKLHSALYDAHISRLILNKIKA